VVVEVVSVVAGLSTELGVPEMPGVIAFSHLHADGQFDGLAIGACQLDILGHLRDL